MKSVKGLSKMTIFQHKYYFVKSVHERGRGVKNMSTWFIDDPILDDTFSYSERNLVLHILGPHSVKSVSKTSFRIIFNFFLILNKRCRWLRF